MDVDDVHDGAAGLAQVRRRALAQEERRAQVGADEVVPLAARDAPKGCGVEGRSVVHEAVQPAEARGGFVGQFREAVDVEQVGGDGLRAFEHRVVERDDVAAGVEHDVVVVLAGGVDGFVVRERWQCTTMRAPSACSARAIAAPMRRAAPVTRTARSCML